MIPPDKHISTFSHRSKTPSRDSKSSTLTYFSVIGTLKLYAVEQVWKTADIFVET